MNIIKKHSDRYIINNFKTFDFLILSYIKTINYWIFMERVNVIKEFWQYTYVYWSIEYFIIQISFTWILFFFNSKLCFQHVLNNWSHFLFQYYI